MFVICGFFALAACANGEMKAADRSQAPPAPVQYVLPTGMLTTADALPATQGVYAVPVGGGERCCWVNSDVRFVVPLARGAKSLYVDVLYPGIAVFHGKKQTISELDAAGKTIATRSVPFGPPTTIVFPLIPAHGARSVLPVHLRFSTSVVPHDAGVGADVRRLALIVTNVYVR